LADHDCAGIIHAYQNAFERAADSKILDPSSSEIPEGRPRGSVLSACEYSSGGRSGLIRTY
jgi:hypothetical protein